MDVFNNTVSERQKSLHLYNFEKSVLQFLIRPVTCRQKKKKKEKVTQQLLAEVGRQIRCS